MTRAASLPIVSRELIAASRRSGTYWSRTTAGLVGILGVVLLLLPSYGGASLSSAELGRTLFETLSGVMFLFCMFSGPALTADCLSVERREGTLGLLFLTDLKGRDVVLGKLAATSVNAVYRLMALVPLVAVCFILGGVGAAQYARALGALFCVTFFSLSVGLFTSAICTEGRKSVGLAFGLILMINLIPAAILLSIPHVGRNAIELWIVPLSPIFWSLGTLTSPSAIASNKILWAGAVVTLFYGAVFFSAACWLAPRVWRQRQPRPIWRRLREWGLLFSSGTMKERKAWRAASLDKNAYFWLAAREKHRNRLVWLYIAALMAIWLRAGATVGYVWWLDWPTFVVSMLVLQSSLKIWVAVQAARQFTEDRKSGAIELLLSSPLSVREQLDGQWLALRKQFLKPCLACILIEVFLFSFSKNVSADGGPEAWILGTNLVVFPLDLWAMAWISMAQASVVRNSKSPASTAVARIMCLPWLITLVTWAVVSFIQFGRYPLIDQGQTWVMGWAVLSIWISLFFGLLSRRRIFKQFRGSAERRFQPADGAPPAPPRPRSASR